MGYHNPEEQQAHVLAEAEAAVNTPALPADPAASADTGGSEHSYLALISSSIFCLSASLSGYPGAATKWGKAIGWNSVASTFFLNWDGFLDVTKRKSDSLLPTHVPDFAKLSCYQKFWLITGCTIAAAPAAILSGRGSSEVFDTENYAIIGVFGLINGIVSTAVNIQSFLAMATGIKRFIKYFFTDPYHQYTAPNATNTDICIATIKIIMGVILIVYGGAGAVYASIARGYSTFAFIKTLAEKAFSEAVAKILGYAGFSVASLPGFAMFVAGLCNFFPYVGEQIESLCQRSQGYTPVPDAHTTQTSSKMIALMLALYCAAFAALNYFGLSIEAEKADWVFGKIMATHLHFEHDTAALAGIVASISSVNLLKRAESFSHRVDPLITRMQKKCTDKVKGCRTHFSESLCGCGLPGGRCCCLRSIVCCL